MSEQERPPVEPSLERDLGRGGGSIELARTCGQERLDDVDKARRQVGSCPTERFTLTSCMGTLDFGERPPRTG